MPTPPPPPPGSLVRPAPAPEFPSPRLRLGLTLVLLAAIVALLLPLGMRSATAAELGAGYSNSSGTFIGAMRYDGQNAYCIELTKPRPVGKPTRPLGADEPMPAAISALSAGQRAQLHWALSGPGTSTDPMVTTAVAMLVWSIADAAHYPGDEHYYAKMPQSTASAVAAELAALRGEVATVQLISRPQSVAVEVVREQDGVHIQVPKVGTGVEVTLSLEAASYQGEPRVVLDGGTSHDLLVRADTTQPEVIAQVWTAPADGYATADVRVLVTEGRQLLVQASQAAWPQASDRLGIGVIGNKTRTPPVSAPAPTETSTIGGNSPATTPAATTAPTATTPPSPTATAPATEPAASQPTPTTAPPAAPKPTPTEPPKPSPTATKTPVPTTTPKPAPASTPPAPPVPITPADAVETSEAPKPPVTPTTTPPGPAATPPAAETVAPTPPPAEAPAPEAAPSTTPATTPTPTPAPTMTPTESASPTAPSTPTEEVAPGESLPESPAPDAAPDAAPETPRLAETGTKPGIWFGVAGAGLALIGLGGWLLARDRQRREANTW